MAEGLELISQLADQTPASTGGVVADKKKHALQVVLENGIPGRTLEAWKYTDGAGFLSDRAGIAPAGSKDKLAGLIAAALPVHQDCFRIVFLNGVYQPDASDASIPGLLEISSLFDPAMDATDPRLGRLGASGSLAQNVFANINMACAPGALSVRVPRGVALDKPVVVYSCITAEAARSMLFPRVIVEIEESAAADFIEVVSSENDSIAYSSFSVVETFVADNARLSYTLVNSHSREAFVFNALSGSVQSNAALQTGVFNFGSSTTRNEIFTTLVGQNSRSDILGLNVLDARQAVDNHTVVDHAVPHCESYEMIKGIYDDSSKGIFDGTIIVRPDAQKTNAIQSNQSLLLSDSATSNAKPQLKIWADDVKCTHGATVGQLDEQALFYIRSRGVALEDARAMLIHAFASEVVKDVRVDFLQESLEILISEKLGATA